MASTNLSITVDRSTGPKTPVSLRSRRFTIISIVIVCALYLLYFTPCFAAPFKPLNTEYYLWERAQITGVCGAFTGAFIWVLQTGLRYKLLISGVILIALGTILADLPRRIASKPGSVSIGLGKVAKISVNGTAGYAVLGTGILIVSWSLWQHEL
jgi:hypothetical protein